MENNICILLGAGVSVEQKLPNWIDLVEGVIDYYGINLDVDKNNLIESIGIMEDSQLNLIHQRLTSKNIVVLNEQKWARQKIALATRVCLKKKLFNVSFDTVKKRMELMKEIAECVYERAQKEKLTTIITYNFDDYFEFTYKYVLHENNEIEKYDDHLASYTIGEDEQHIPSGEREEKLVNVYHVHGCIPIFDELYGFKFSQYNKEEYKNQNIKSYQNYLSHGVVFSGNDYNLLLDDSIVGWTNMIQYIAYSQLPVSIIGFSLTDVNFRALLRRMKKSKISMKNIIVFLGYKNQKQKKSAFASKETAKYLFKGICTDITCEPKKFGKPYVDEVGNQLRSYLIESNPSS